jgi:hypothetical protein
MHSPLRAGRTELTVKGRAVETFALFLTYTSPCQHLHLQIDLSESWDHAFPFLTLPLAMQQTSCLHAQT